MYIRIFSFLILQNINRHFGIEKAQDHVAIVRAQTPPGITIGNGPLTTHLDGFKIWHDELRQGLDLVTANVGQIDQAGKVGIGIKESIIVGTQRCSTHTPIVKGTIVAIDFNELMRVSGRSTCDKDDGSMHGRIARQNLHIVQRGRSITILHGGGLIVKFKFESHYCTTD